MLLSSGTALTSRPVVGRAASRAGRRAAVPVRGAGAACVAALLVAVYHIWFHRVPAASTSSSWWRYFAAARCCGSWPNSVGVGGWPIWAVLAEDRAPGGPVGGGGDPGHGRRVAGSSCPGRSGGRRASRGWPVWPCVRTASHRGGQRLSAAGWRSRRSSSSGRCRSRCSRIWSSRCSWWRRWPRRARLPRPVLVGVLGVSSPVRWCSRSG